MPLDATDGAKILQLITSRYNDRLWRRKIEKTLSLPPKGLLDDKHQKIFLYLKLKLQVYKSRRADPPSWIVGGFATKEVIDRARFNPHVVDPSFTQDDVAFLGIDPGEDVDAVWWEDMLVKWFEEPEEDVFEDEPLTDELPAESEGDRSSSSPQESSANPSPHP